MGRYAIVDLETTGGNREGHKVTEVAIITVDEGVVTGEWSSLVNPERPIPWGITRLTGISDDMVAAAPPFYKLAKKIVELTEGRVFVAHNAFFDYRFLQREFSELGYTFQREVLCTVRLARQAFPGLKSYALTNLSKHFELRREAEHRALDDTRACWEVFRRILAQSESVLATAQTKPLPPELDDGVVQGLPEGPGTYFFYTREGLLLYVGKAKNIRARVRGHFQSAGEKKRDRELRQHVARVDYQLWGSEALASLMELHFIKTLRPALNRAGRKTNYRYGLALHPQAPAGQELRVITGESDEAQRFGSRRYAEAACERIYQEAFGVRPGTLSFPAQMEVFRRTLGAEQVAARLREKLQEVRVELSDGSFALPAPPRHQVCQLVVAGGELKEVQLVDEQGEVHIYPLENYPDMRRVVAKLQARTGAAPCGISSPSGTLDLLANEDAWESST